MKKYLPILILIISSLFVSPCFANTHYVATDGEDTGDCTNSESPCLTIAYGISQISGGDTLQVADGTYDITSTINLDSGISGTLSNYTVIRAENKHGAVVRVTTLGIVSAFKFRTANYVEINGFDISTWNFGSKTYSYCDSNPSNCMGHCIGGDYKISTVPQTCHHWRIIDNILHHCGDAGLSSERDDFIYAEGNIIHHNAFWSPYGQSGITLYIPEEVTGTGDSGEYVANLDKYFRNVIRRNFIYANENIVERGGGGWTDGNGIILDRYDVYTYTGPWTLVENNVVFDNGARCIHGLYAYNAVVRNNTCYKNLRNSNISGTWKADMYFQSSEDILIYNNIIQGEGTTQDYQQTFSCADSTDQDYQYNLVFVSGLTTPSDYIVCGSGGGCAEDCVTNAYQPGTDCEIWEHHSSDCVIYSGTNHIIGQDPLFINPSIDPDLANFTLQSGSPAKDSGLSSVCASEDFNGNARPLGSGCDMGAYEYEEITSFFTGATPSGGSYQ